MSQTTTFYELEHLTRTTVNVVIIESIVLEGKEYELSRSRTCYANSPLGRQHVESQLPADYVSAIFAVWGPNSTVDNPQA